MFCCNGKKQDLSEPCQSLNGPVCYNSYQESQFLGYNAHFSCPEICVPLLDMCQGMSWCEQDVNVCNENLTVPRSIQFKAENSLYGELIEKKSLTNSKAPDHHYYIQNAEGKLNNGQYDIIDRSDEDLNNSKVENINLTKLHLCKDDFDGNPGVQCDEHDSECIPRYEWCNDSPKVCGAITTGNSRVCSNPTFWKDIPCTFDVYSSFDVLHEYKGEVCPGRPGQCYYPWYRRSDANIQFYSDYVDGLKILSHTCKDKSDQVFPLNQTCPNRTQYHQMGLTRFCHKCDGCDPDPRDFRKNICQDRLAEFLMNTTITDWIDDPHNCWGSCSEPGENCLACSNTDYFQCPRSQVRINNNLLGFIQRYFSSILGLHSSRLEV